MRHPPPARRIAGAVRRRCRCLPLRAWSATFDSFAIGSETIKNAELAIMDEAPQGRGMVDVILGADFLRTHRVLFAMSQQRLYISHLDGAVFARTGNTAR